MTIRVGTSGFFFEDWKGIVYPPHLKKEDWLRYYEKELGFNALEINFTYYTLTSSRSLEGMCQKTSGQFQFTVKAFKGMTHDIKEQKKHSLLPNQQTFVHFIQSLRPLTETGKLGCVLAQFPYSFLPTDENLDYLKRFKEMLGNLPLVIEFRNRAWFNPRTLQFLKEHNLGYCVVDEPRLPQLMPFSPEVTSEIGYLRFHGRNPNWFNVPTTTRYNYLYSEEELSEFISPIKTINNKAHKVFIFFNNCHAGSAAKNAISLIRLLQKEAVFL